MKYGLIGERLSHSYSKKIHAYFGDYTYEIVECNVKEIPEILKDGGFSGLNVTVPYKKEVMQYCDEISEIAKRCGAVNTLCFENGKIIGYNTDYFGIDRMMKLADISVTDKKALILGSGGASGCVKAYCEDEKAKEIVIISRSGENNYTNLEKHADADIIINTTPVGMYPNIFDAPLSLDIFKGLYAVCDLIYNPLNTRLLLDARDKGIKAANGLDMLVSQGAYSARLWNAADISDMRIAEICREIPKKMMNIVLCGMPGCGKSTVGRILANSSGKEFIDTDELIYKKFGKVPESIINEQGEAVFRRYESEIIREIAPKTNCVIALGGGALLREENASALKQNGEICFLKRDISLLDTKNRPLSKNLGELYKARLPIYEKYADFCVDNINTPENVAEIINKIHFNQ